MPIQKKDVAMNLRVSSETRDMVKELAASEGRNVTNWIEWVIRREHEKLKEKRRG